MEERIQAKDSSYGIVEIKRRSDGWYLLYVSGDLKSQSADLNYILREYDQYR